jgi:N utilization substance protein B
VGVEGDDEVGDPQGAVVVGAGPGAAVTGVDAGQDLYRLAVIDRLVLRLAVYELLERPEVPPAVVINEALELARTFSGPDAVRFVNGVLNQLARQKRPQDFTP